MVVYLVCEGWVLSFPSFGRNLLGFDFVLSSTEHFLYSCPHPRQAECGCRPGFPSGTHFHRVDVGPRVLRIHLPRVSIFPDSGPFCYEGHFQAHLLCFSMSRSTGLSSGCLGSFFGLESVPFDLCLPSSGIHALPYSENSSVQGSDASDCSFEFEQLLDCPSPGQSIQVPSSPGESLSLPVCASRDSRQADKGVTSSASFLHSASLGLGVRGPSSSVCLSYEVPVLNPAGSSRVSPVRSDLPFEGFSSQRDPGIPRSRWGILFLFFEGFLLLGTLLVNFQNQFVFPSLPFLPGLLFLRKA